MKQDFFSSFPGFQTPISGIDTGIPGFPLAEKGEELREGSFQISFQPGRQRFALRVQRCQPEYLESGPGGFRLQTPCPGFRALLSVFPGIPVQPSFFFPRLFRIPLAGKDGQLPDPVPHCSVLPVPIQDVPSQGKQQTDPQQKEPQAKPQAPEVPSPQGKDSSLFLIHGPSPLSAGSAGKSL